MKMNSHSRSFVLLVKHDLLAFSDEKLLHQTQQWVETAAQTNGLSNEVLNNSRVALGYTLVGTGLLHQTALENEQQLVEQWHSPAPAHLRALLTNMDAQQFLEYVIPLAFQSLHKTHPEWGEGMLFHAHLANYLRQKEQKTRRR